MSEDHERSLNRSLPPVSTVAGLPGILLGQGVLSAPLRPGQLARLEHYQVLSVLGQGGMGVVLRGVESLSGTTVAIKLLKPELAVLPQLVHRFLKEARHMQRLKHPNILPVLHVSQNPTVPYFVMPLIEPGSLAKQLTAAHPLPEEECATLARQVAAAIAHAHARGLIHRDLKPDNVLVNAQGKAWLTDFGLARTVFNDSWLDPASTGHCEGTAAYMSPQLARGEAEDTRCDIYALGAMLYELLTGHPPYEGSSTTEILQRIRHGPPPPVRERRHGISASLVRVVEGAMAREQRDRYASMADVVADLERIEQGRKPVGSRGAFSWRRFPFPGWGYLAAGAFVLLMLAITITGSSVFRDRLSLTVQRSFSLPWVTSWSAAKLGDWDGDGEADIVYLSDHILRVVARNGQHFQPVELNVPRTTSMRLGSVIDTTGDGLDEAIVHWAVGSNAFLAAFNQVGWPVKQFTFSGSVNVHPEWGTNKTSLLPIGLADLEGDGKQELLVSVGSTWALRPRGLACFDLDSSELRWFFETAPFVAEVKLWDLDDDGQLELVVGTGSPANGCVLEDGTDDRHAYLYVLSSHGRLLWRRELAGQFAQVRPLDAGLDDPTVTVWVSSTHALNVLNQQTPVGMVLKLDSSGHVTHSRDLGGQLMSALATDLDADGTKEVLVTDRLGVLHALNEHLQPRQRLAIVGNRFDEVDLVLHATGLLGKDNRPYAVLTSSQVEYRTEPHPGNTRQRLNTRFYHDNRVIVLDNQLNLVATHLVSDKWTEFPGFTVHLLPATKDGPPELLVLADQALFLGLNRTRRSWLSRGVAITPLYRTDSPVEAANQKRSNLHPATSRIVHVSSACPINAPPITPSQ